MKRLLLMTVGGLIGTAVAFSQPMDVNGVPAIIERGTYHNYFSCQNPAYSVFANFGEESGADSRLGQFLVGWDTTEVVPPNRPPAYYLIRHCRVTITLNNGSQVIHDPTHDDYRTYIATNNPAWLPDADAGRPIELFGAGFRNGYSATNFFQCSPVGNGLPGSNNVFAISWTTNGLPVDIGNSVGKSLEEFAPFETWPFAVAQTADAASGDAMPAGARLTFDLNLADPFAVGYLQNGLRQGRLNFVVSALHEVSGQFGAEPYPAFTTRFNQAVIDPPTTLNLELTVVRDRDTDGDDLPDDWEQFYFTNLVQTAQGDFDNDGAKNESEFHAGTNPTATTSVFRIAAAQGSVFSSRELHWPNLPGRKFSVQFTEDLSTWQTVTNPALIFHVSSVVQWTDQNATNAHRFYRVQADVD
jgi:hypothetical protein